MSLTTTTSRTETKSPPRVTTILVAESDEQLRQFLSLLLQKHGYQVVTAKTGIEAVQQCLSSKVDLVLLDLTMHNKDGFTVLRKIRFFSKVPILILSPFSNPNSTIKALNMGADSYIIKPFSAQEFLARVESILRRVSWAAAHEESKISVGNSVVVWKDRPQVTVGGRQVQLTITEHKILLCLAVEAGKTVSKEQILRAVWRQSFLDSSILTQNMHRLRNKLERSAGGHPLIRTEYGVGYSLQAA